MRHALGGGMRAMGGGEGVVDKNIGIGGQGLGQCRIVLLFTCVETGVFQHQHVAMRELGHGFGGRRANAVISKGDRLAEHFGQRGSHRGQRHVRHALALRAVEMAAHDHPRALIRQLADGGGEAFDAGEVGNLAVAHRHVEVGTQQNALASNIDTIELTVRHL